MDISIESPPHCRLHYEILAGLDLGEDAANLYRPDLPKTRRARRLRRAYLAAPAGLLLQIIPLIAADLKSELDLLRNHRPPPLDDGPGRKLTSLFADLLEERAEERSLLLENPPQVDWLSALQECRRHLWKRIDAAAPPLRILHCPSLATRAEAAWTHGRATTVDGKRVVAICLDIPEERAFIQVLHEEIHPVTDPPILARFKQATRSTRKGRAGFSLHAAMEEEAVEVGRQILEACAPQYLDAYQSWCGHYGMA